MGQKLLIAVDGSENSLKAVKHVGEILRNGKDVEVTLLHVLETPPSLQEHAGPKDLPEFDRASEKWETSQRSRVDAEIFAPAKKLLVGHGLAEHLITVRTELVETNARVAVAIVREIKTGGYIAVVVGRRGRSMLMDFVIGSVASKLVHHVQGCAVWIVE